MIALHNIHATMGSFTLEGINLSVPTSSHALLGPSGAGKSTLLKLILGLIHPQSGKIYFDQKDITALKPYERNFGYVPQHLALFPHMNVHENILYGIKAQKKDVDKKFLDELLTLSRLEPLLHRYPSTLSGGERQRVALLRALAIQPKLLVLDEPFSALDITLKQELWMFLKRVQKEFSIPTLFITHDLDEAYFLADSVSVMINGKIEQTGTKEEVFSHPKTVSVAKYLGYKNIFKAYTKDGVLYIPSLQTSFQTNIRCEKECDILIVPEKILLQPSSKNSLHGSIEWLQFKEHFLGIFKTENGAYVYIKSKEKIDTNSISVPPSAFIKLH